MNSFPHSIDIIPGALLFVVGSEMSTELTLRIARFQRNLDELQQIGIIDIVPSYTSILVIYDETVLSPHRLIEMMLECWERTSLTPDIDGAESISIDVVYGENFGDDLANVSVNAGLSVDEVITLHASGLYTVGAVGFAPGFTYLIGLPPQLATPRRAKPRLRVPAGSVGIGGSQTGIYALESAGGWNLIGRSPTTLFDPDADPPVRLRLGDTVRFNPVRDVAFDHLDPKSPSPQGDGVIEVVSAGMQTTVQDLGRYGVARYGFSPDGAADRHGLVQANRLVSNPISASALEITQLGPHLRFHMRMQFALAGADLGARLNNRHVAPGRRFETMPGDELSFEPTGDTVGARAYLAVRGGFDVPLVMGSASTNLTAGIGGWHGRALVRGDRLSPGQREFPKSVFAPGLQREADTRSDAPFRVMAGPQRSRFDDETWQRLLNQPFRVSEEANRVGIRLLGPSLSPIAGADIVSEGIVTGSIQVTGEGQAIVMLPGHATIGGYAKIATVIAEDWDRLGQLSPGDTLRFTAYS